jgi:hypothetical protein
VLLAIPSPERAAASVAFPWSSDAERVRGWQEDLDSTLTAWLPQDRSFDPEARARFSREIQALRGSVTSLSDETIVAKLATAIAGARNAHTRLYLLRNRGVLRRYPIRVWWFGKDLAIVRAKPEHEDLVGGRIVTIAGLTPARAAERVKPLYAGNSSWARYMSTYLLTSPEILRGVDVLRDDTLEVVVETPAKKLRTVRLAPMPLERTDKPTEAWWDLAPTHPGVMGPWISALPADSTRLPLFLRQLSRWYWTYPIPDQDMLYLQYNRSEDQPGQETVKEFGARVLADLQRDPPRKLVLDLRFKTVLGRTPKEEILRVQLERARSLLTGSNLPRIRIDNLFSSKLPATSAVDFLLKSFVPTSPGYEIRSATKAQVLGGGDIRTVSYEGKARL